MVLVLLTSCLEHTDWCSFIICLYIREAGLMLLIILVMILFLVASNVLCACVFLAGSNMRCAVLITRQKLEPFMQHGACQCALPQEHLVVLFQAQTHRPWQLRMKHDGAFDLHPLPACPGQNPDLLWRNILASCPTKFWGDDPGHASI